MIPALKLIAKLYFRSRFQFIISVVFPLLLMLILGRLSAFFYLTSDYPSVNGVLASVICAAAGSTGIVTLAVNTTAIKQSTIMKRIGVTPIKPISFLIATLIFYFALSWLVYGLILLEVFLIFTHGNSLNGHTDIFYWSRFHTVDFLLSTLLVTIFCCSFGLFIGSVSPSIDYANTFSIICYMPLGLLSGWFIPISLISSHDVFNVLSSIFPQRWILNLVFNSTTQLSITLPGLQIAGALVVSALIVSLSTFVWRWER